MTAIRARQIALGCAAVVAALGVAALSIRDTATVSALLGALILLLIVAAPDTGLYTLAIALPVSQTTFGIKLISDQDLLLIVVACLAGRLAAGRTTRPRAPAVALGAAIVGYFLLSATVVGGIGISGHDLRGLLALSALLVCMPLITGNDVATRRALLVFAFATALVAAAEIPTSRSAVATYANLSTVNSAAAAASQTGSLNHNTEGALFVLALCVLLARCARARHSMARLAMFAAIAVLAAGVAYSFSRSSYFGALAVLAVFVVRRSVRGLIIAAVAALCLIPVLPAAVAARIGSVWSSSGLDGSSATRLNLWRSALRMFWHQPLVGIGYLHFSSLLPAYYQDTGNYNVSAVNFAGLNYAHNIFLTVLSQTGLVGAVLLGTLIVVGWRAAWAVVQANDWVGESAVLAFVGIGVCSLFGDPMFATAVLAAFLLVVLAARHAARERYPQSRVAGDIRLTSLMRAASNV